MPPENHPTPNVVDPSEDPNDSLVDPSEDPQNAEVSSLEPEPLEEPINAGDGPNR